MQKSYKKIYAMMFSGFIALGMTSCGDSFFIERPSDGVDAKVAVKSSEDLGSIRTGLYKALKGNSAMVDYYGANMFLYAEMHGEDLQYNSSYGSNRALFYYEMKYTKGADFNSSTAIWQSPYIVIGTACRLIDKTNDPTLSDKDAAKATIDQYRAEAQVIRAMATFDLTRIYGKTFTADNGASLGVPLVTTDLEADAKPSRNTVAECYDQIIKDLTEAINSNALPKVVETGYISHYAAKTLLARVYLTKGDWANALSAAEDVINNSNHPLWGMTEYVNAWKKDDRYHNNEMLFELSITNSNDWVDRPGIAYLYHENNSISPGYTEVCATKQFVNILAEDPNDVRINVFLAPEADGDSIFNGAKVYLNKMPAYNGDVRYSNIPMIRVSEAYLIAAEAAFKNGDRAKAAQYLNELIRNRTSTASRLVTATTITAERISLERRKELVGEGHRFFDALRNNETITRYTNEEDRGWHMILPQEERSYNRDYYKSLAAIPIFETDANENLEKQQNPGY